MQNPKTGGNRWVPDIRPENIDTYTENNEEQSAEYKIVDAHPIIGGVLDKLAFFRTHASAVWYNKLKNITVLQQLDNLASNIGTLAKLPTIDKTSLVAAVNELNVKTSSYISAGLLIPNGSDLNTYKTPGKYRTLLAANTATLINAPIDNSAFSMYVEILGPGDWVRQTLKRVSTLETYVRLYNPMNQNWSDWTRIIL